jgi:hypothetical protein
MIFQETLEFEEEKNKTIHFFIDIYFFFKCE